MEQLEEGTDGSRRTMLGEDGSGGDHLQKAREREEVQGATRERDCGVADVAG